MADQEKEPEIYESRLRFFNQTVGRTRTAAVIAKSWWVPISIPANLMCALGNSDERLSLTSVKNSTQAACKKRAIHFSAHIYIWESI